MARRDVAVIGAGLYGTSLACCLAREGMTVALHERTLPGAGDTGRSFGMIRRHYSNEVTVRLAKRGCELLQSDPSIAFVRTGYMLTVGPEQSHACLANVALGREGGVDTDLLAPDPGARGARVGQPRTGERARVRGRGSAGLAARDRGRRVGARCRRGRRRQAGAGMV